MERTSIITRLSVALASAYPSLTLVNGLPNAESLATYFDEAPLLIEGADYKEQVTDTDQGQLVSHSIRARIGRDETFYLLHANKLVILYLEMVNGEKYFLGTNNYPLLYLYDRDSGAGNADTRDTVLTYSQTVPV